jgi:hypothetical protein
MKRAWVHPDTITGEAASAGRYLRREYINELFWREVRKGNHILFVAPRRVGKTSIMKDLAANCPEGFLGVYEDIEGVKTRNEFYKRLFDLILYCVDRSKLKEAKAFIERCLKRYSILEISKSGVRIDAKELDYEREIRDLIPELRKAAVHAVIFLDEFAEVIYRLKKSGRQQDAVDILHALREIRSDGDFKHFTIVYAGSIGLEFVIKNIDRPKLINDLHRIQLNPLTGDEATKLVRQLTEGASIRISAQALDLLKGKIDYLLPYYIQLMIESINEVAFENGDPEVTAETVEKAYWRVLKEKKNFEDWLERLKDYQPDHFPLINDILKYAARNGEISIQTVYAISEGYELTQDYMDFVEELIHDGYLVESRTHIYRFISPLLQQFWLAKYPIYDVRGTFEAKF